MNENQQICLRQHNSDTYGEKDRCSTGNILFVHRAIKSSDLLIDIYI